MARPTKQRRICKMPKIKEFVPAAESYTKVIEMTIDEFEAIRLIDHLECSQEECAKQMNVSRTTVQAIYDSARKKLAGALVEGERLSISGGAYELCPKSKACCKKSCGRKNCSETGK